RVDAFPPACVESRRGRVRCKKSPAVGRAESGPRHDSGPGRDEMGFLSGRITYVRYRVGGTSPLPFGEEILEQAQLHAIGRHGAADPTDGVAVGWCGGEHVLDMTFDPGKNVIDDALHLAIRVDSDKIPGVLLRAYTKIETDARAQLNPSGYPTKAQRLEAK